MTAPGPSPGAAGPEVVVRACQPGDLGAVRSLLAGYGAGVDIPAYQRFDEEIAGLPGPYAGPDGCLLVACVSERVVGCCAVRKLAAGVCEMKRLFADPDVRGRGIGALLVDRIIAEARALGYRRMKLDTDPAFASAVALYQSRGFRPCERYNADDDPRTLFYQLDL